MTTPNLGNRLVQEIVTGSSRMTNRLKFAPAAALPEMSPELLKVEAEELSEQLVNIAVQPDPHICVLWVQECTGSNQFRTYASNPQVGAVTIDTPFSFQRPLKQETLSAEEAWNIMMEFVEGLADLAVWFNSVRKTVDELPDQPVPILIIADSVGPRIPWEMFQLHMEDGIAVGSEMMTVRWGAPRATNFDLLKLEAPEVCAGQILAHFDPDEWSKTGIKATHQPLLDLTLTECQNITDLLVHFKTPRDDVGFVYVLCHGIDDGSTDFAFGSLDNSNQRIRRSDLRKFPLTLFQRSKAIIFMNACNTAGAKRSNDYIYVKRNVTMVDMLLTKGARGVIGTLDSVELKHAAETAQEFIKLIRTDPGIPVAEALRRLRKRALQELRACPTDMQYEKWYHTFQYVFYGHPLTSLNLSVCVRSRPRPVAEANDD